MSNAPGELKLTSDDTNDQSVNYLDLHLEIKDNSVQHRIFDKRDNFKFPIVNFPDLSGNIPNSHSYAVFTSQLVRFARGCQHYTDFKSRTEALIQRLVKQKFKMIKLIKTFQKFSIKHYPLLKKYRVPMLLDIHGFLISKSF